MRGLSISLLALGLLGAAAAAAQDADGRFSLDLPALDVVILHLVTEPWPPSEASDVLGGKPPLLLSDWTAVSGEARVDWSAACGATDHALLTGPLDLVASRSWDRVQCGLGISGPVGVLLEPGSRFYALVGRSESQDGSAGRDSFGGERPGADLALSCALPQVLDVPCP